MAYAMSVDQDWPKGAVPLYEIQYLLGHASIVTTQWYPNVTLGALAESVKKSSRKRRDDSFGHPAVIHIAATIEASARQR